MAEAKRLTEQYKKIQNKFWHVQFYKTQMVRAHKSDKVILKISFRKNEKKQFDFKKESFTISLLDSPKNVEKSLSAALIFVQRKLIDIGGHEEREALSNAIREMLSKIRRVLYDRDDSFVKKKSATMIDNAKTAGRKAEIKTQRDAAERHEKADKKLAALTNFAANVENPSQKPVDHL